MAYAPGPRINHFSNPAVYVGGHPTGVMNTAAGGADNAMTINATAPIVADFRDAPIYSFGEGKQTSQGEYPELTWAGTPEVQNNEFELTLTGAVPRTFGILLRGANYYPHPFHGGTLYFGHPFTRIKTVRADLDGAVTTTVDISSANAGATDYYQVFFRDSLHLDETGIGLSNSVKVTYLP